MNENDYSTNNVESTPQGSSSRAPWSIAELTLRIRGALEPRFSSIWVKGEISNGKLAPSGHLYFSLKDQDAMISAAFFGWASKKRGDITLKDGLEVLCHGRVSVYGPRGNYQIIVDHIQPLGAGMLQAKFEQLKEKLSKEGLFDVSLKRPMPALPKTVAVVTSPTGAAIRDFITVMQRRAPWVQIRVIPSLVQGEGASAQLIQGIRAVNHLKLADVLVVCRGGGSIEDLWSFNDEGLAREIRNSLIPVVSAVGHEVDFTIADFVADLRAPTPSAAAEILSENWVSMSERLGEVSARLHTIAKQSLRIKALHLTAVRSKLKSPVDRLRERVQTLDDLRQRLDRGVFLKLERQGAVFKQTALRLESVSPLKVLERGYSLVKDSESGEVIKSKKQAKKGKNVTLVFSDGEKGALIS